MPYQMSNGKWRAKRMILGRTKTKTCATKKEALAWEAGQSADRWTVAETQTVTALEWANRYLDYATANFAEQTVREKRLAFRRLFEIVAQRTPVDEIDITAAMALMRKVQQVSTGCAANTARKELAAAWTWGIKYMGLHRQNPFHGCDKVAADQRPRHIPTEAEFWSVYEQAQREAQVYLLAALHTAARKGELLRLTWSDIDIEGRKIRLGTRKRKGGGMEYDWVPMTTILADAMRAHKAKARSVYVFCDGDGQPFARRGELLVRLCRRAGVKTFGMHAIRHLSASMLAKAGVDIPTIQAILRHKSPTTTAVYLKQLGGVRADIERVFNVVPFPRTGKAFGT